MIPLLAKEHRVIAMDMLGCGNSDSLPPVIEIQYLAQNVVHVLDALQIDRFHLFGLHTGARVSGEVAASFPDRVASLVLTGYSFLEKDDWALLRATNPATEATTKGEGISTVGELDGSHLLKAWARAHSNVVKFLVHASNSQSQRFHLSPIPGIRGQQGMDAYITRDHLEFMDHYLVDSMQSRGRMNQIHDQGLLLYNSRARLALIKAPTIHINSDSPYEADFSKRGHTLAKIIPNCEVATLSPADDNSPEFNPEGLAAIMLDFLRKHPLKRKVGSR